MQPIWQQQHTHKHDLFHLALHKFSGEQYTETSSLSHQQATIQTKEQKLVIKMTRTRTSQWMQSLAEPASLLLLKHLAWAQYLAQHPLKNHKRKKQDRNYRPCKTHTKRIKERQQFPITMTTCDWKHQLPHHHYGD